MRRLPIYFLIDISESMVGEPIQLVEEGLATIVKALKEDPYALETVYISIVVFAGQPKTLVPLQEVISFYPPRFPIGGGTSLSNGLGHLMYELRTNIVKTTMEQKGDWKPIVFLFTDGVPTNNSAQAIEEWKKNWHSQVNMVAISFGSETDMHTLKEITDNVYLFQNTTAQQYKEFFKWVTASIKTSSVSVNNNSTGFDLAKMDDKVLSKVDLTKQAPPQANAPQTNVDTNFAVFIAKCQNTKKPYLIKYRRNQKPVDFGGITMDTLSYRLVGAFPVDQSYFELSDNEASHNKISTEELEGFPACPCCGNQYGLSICSCSKMHCVGTEAVSTCPWCGNQGSYGSGEGHFDIDRTQG
ncbi:MAG: TerY-C metal binding domain-containing protein [Bacteroidota bacterium]